MTYSRTEPAAVRLASGKKKRRLAALALLALIGAGCSQASTPRSSSSGNGGSGGAGSAANSNPAAGGNPDKAVQFAQCMRSNGITNFPDPSASGQFTIDAIANGSGVDTSSAAFQQAMSACKNLEPAGFTGTARTAQQQAAGIRFAQCIRDHGVPDFPDPTPDGPLVDTNRIPSAGTSAGMSSLNAAMRQCGSFAAEAGVTGGK